MLRRDGLQSLAPKSARLPVVQAGRTSAPSFIHHARDGEAGMVDQADMTGARTAAAFRDDDGAIRAEFLEQVREAIERGDAAALQALAGDLHEADTGDLIEALDAELRPRFVELMGREFDFTALTEVDDAVREEILEELPPQTVAEGVRDLDSDDAVHILEDLPEQEQAEILEQMPPPERGARRAHPALSGEFRRPADADRVHRGAAVLDRRRRHRPSCARPPTCRSASSSSMWSTTSRKLLGAVALDRLLRTKRPVPVAELMDPDRRRVRATDDQEEVARMFERYNLVAAPVVDDGERLVGVLTFDDIVDVIEEEAEEDIRALGGVTHDEELAELGLDDRARPLQLAAGQSRHRVPGFVGARAVRGPARKDGGARGAGADRGEPGRQRHHPDHDGRGARARHPRADRRQRLAGDRARAAGRAGQRPRLRRHHRRRRLGLVQGARPRHRHRRSPCSATWSPRRSAASSSRWA